MDKRKRELAKAIKPYGYKIVGLSGRTHYILRNRKTGHELRASYSPKCLEHAIDNVLKDIRRHG